MNIFLLNTCTSTTSTTINYCCPDATCSENTTSTLSYLANIVMPTRAFSFASKINKGNWEEVNKTHDNRLNNNKITKHAYINLTI